MLYIVSTPIGNLDDLSYRQAKTIVNSDIILAEDTRTFQKLLSGIEKIFNLKPKSNQKTISYYKENEFEKLPEVLELLREGSVISLVSEAGTPLVSDPGSLLVKEVIKENLPYDVVPGPSAVVNALVLSGFPPKSFFFLGFLPTRENDLKKLFQSLEKDMTYVAFESPHRINDSLTILASINSSADVAICREMTKKFQEVIRGKPEELSNKSYKGELSLVLKL